MLNENPGLNLYSKCYNEHYCTYIYDYVSDNILEIRQKTIHNDFFKIKVKI